LPLNPRFAVSDAATITGTNLWSLPGFDTHIAITNVMSLGARALLFLVTGLQPVAADVKGNGECAQLVDIGGGRKMYLECRGRGSPTVVLVSGTRGAHDDWTHLSDPTKPAGAKRPSESAVFPQVGRLTRVCAYDRPGTALLDDTRTDSTPLRQ